MTAPIWFASPPELHSALLSGGPGPGSLLASAGAWDSLSTAYAEAADELTALLDAMHPGAWDGPTAAAYVAAHAPYLAWLRQAVADNAATAAQLETAAAAYTAALAAMPTLPELAANHATHAALVATNLFGINTIPIALNEADYARMWIQAATVMTTYETVADSAVTAAPPAAAAPPITRAWFDELRAFLEGLVPQVPYPNTSDYPQYQEILTFFNHIGFTEVSDPFADFFSGLNGSSLLPPVGVPGSWLAFTGNPLSYLNPFSIAYVLSVPLDPGSYIAFTSIVIIDDLLAILYTALFNPQALGIVVPLAMVEIIGSTIGNTIQLLHYLIEQTVALIPAILSPLSASLVPLATPVLLGPGLAGLAGLAALPGPMPVAPPGASPLGAALAPGSVSNPSPTPAPAQVVATTPPASAPGSPPAPTPPPGVPPSTVGTGMDALAYLMGGLSLDARRTANTRSTRSPALDDTVVPGTATGADEPAQARRRRRDTLAQLGRGYEYMDVEPEPDAEPAAFDRRAAAAASGHGAGPLGFAGTAGKSAVEAAGLTRLASDTFGGGPAMPMMPRSWKADGS